MRLQKKYAWRFDRSGNPVTSSISEAAADACDGSDYDRGSVETAQAAADAAALMLGALVEKLHEKGVLDDADVLALLAGFEKAED